MALNKDQYRTVQDVVNWYYFDTFKKSVYSLSGYAGTGKTYVAKFIIAALGLRQTQILFVTPTGKAAFVARMRGTEANTIHKTFYTVFKNKQEDRINFSKKKTSFCNINLIIVDEASMVNDNIMKDIISFKIPILLLFDRGQLPPIYGSNSFIKNPDSSLTEIMRQSSLSGIFELSILAREGKPIPLGIYKESDVIWARDIKNIEDYDIILCWKNETKDIINDLVRKRLGYKGNFPHKGEKLVCLKNNYHHLLEYKNDIPIMLVNGIDLIALSEYKDKDITSSFFELEYKPSFIKDDDSCFFNTKVYKKYFLPNKGEHEGEPDKDGIVSLDFGYAYTVHKSQGSEWDNVLIIDEFVGSKEMYNRWLYTAITRAKKRVTIAKVFRG